MPLQSLDRPRIKLGVFSMPAHPPHRFYPDILAEDLEMLDINMKWIVEPGMFKIMVGASSEDIRLNGQFEIVSK